MERYFAGIRDGRAIADRRPSRRNEVINQRLTVYDEPQTTVPADLEDVVAVHLRTNLTGPPSGKSLLVSGNRYRIDIPVKVDLIVDASCRRTSGEIVGGKILCLQPLGDLAVVAIFPKRVLRIKSADRDVIHLGAG